MSVNDAEPGDIYVDGAGKLWRVMGICHEPTIVMEEVEGTLFDPNAPSGLGAAQVYGISSCLGVRHAEITKRQIHGGCSGFMWERFRRIFRPREGGA